MLATYLLLLVFASMTSGYLLPEPQGKYNVMLDTGPLVDYKRRDPEFAVPKPRELMLSIFRPAVCAPTVPVQYMPNKTAAYQGPYLRKAFGALFDLSPFFLQARLPVCLDRPGDCSPLDDAPILLFSPGYGVSRLWYNVLVSSIASQGFMVISIDHPEDANIIEYPDGHAVYNNASIRSNSTWDEYPRAADASFVIDQLGNATAMAQLLPQRGPRPFSTDHVAMLGHSLGGASSIVAASRDPRIRGAINWDGSLFGSPPLDGLSRPVLFMAHSDVVSPTWLEAWPQLKGPKMIAHVADTTHYTFCDLPTLLQSAGNGTLAKVLGTLKPAEMVRLLTAYTTAWMEGAFSGKETDPLLHEEKPREFPEVSVLLRGNFGSQPERPQMVTTRS